LNNTFHIKQGDLWPPLEANLQQADGNYLTLQAEDIVKFMMTPKNKRSDLIINEEVTVIDLETAHVKYIWKAGDTINAGEYQAEFVVLLNGDIPIRVPNNDYFITGSRANGHNLGVIFDYSLADKQ